MTFDTLKFVETLKATGVPEAQAKAQAEALVDALGQGGLDLATKGGIAELMKLRIDVAWIKWILTAGVGVYLVRSIAEWISMGWLRL